MFLFLYLVLCLVASDGVVAARRTDHSGVTDEQGTSVLVVSSNGPSGGRNWCVERRHRYFSGICHHLHNTVMFSISLLFSILQVIIYMLLSY